MRLHLMYVRNSPPSIKLNFIRCGRLGIARCGSAGHPRAYPTTHPLIYLSFSSTLAAVPRARSSEVNLHLAKLNFRSMAFIGLTLSSGCEPRRTTLSGAAAEGVTIAARLPSVLPVATAGDWKVGCS